MPEFLEPASPEDNPPSTRVRWLAYAGTAALTLTTGLSALSFGAGVAGVNIQERPADGLNEVVAGAVWVPAGIMDATNWAGRQADRLAYDVMTWPARELEQTLIPSPLGGQSPDQIDQVVTRADS